MSEKKISKISQNEGDKRDYEAIEMLSAENQADSDSEKEPVIKNDSEKQVTFRRVFKLINLTALSDQMFKYFLVCQWSKPLSILHQPSCFYSQFRLLQMLLFSANPWRQTVMTAVLMISPIYLWLSLLPSIRELMKNWLQNLSRVRLPQRRQPQRHLPHRRLLLGPPHGGTFQLNRIQAMNPSITQPNMHFGGRILLLIQGLKPAMIPDGVLIGDGVLITNSKQIFLPKIKF